VYTKKVLLISKAIHCFPGWYTNFWALWEHFRVQGIRNEVRYSNSVSICTLLTPLKLKLGNSAKHY